MCTHYPPTSHRIVVDIPSKTFIPDSGSSHYTKEGNMLLRPRTLVFLFATVTFLAASIGLGSSVFAKECMPMALEAPKRPALCL
jgi:hypothetical protein